MAEAIESVLGQSWGDYELILVDDGSTDRSGRICDAYGEKYPQIRVIHKENEGLVLARWEAVEAARGQYLTFLDADDRYVPHTLAAVRQEIENTGADLVVFDFCKVFPQGSVRDITEPYADHTVFSGEGKQQLYRDFLWGHRLNSLCRKCIRRDLYDLGENPEQYRGVVQGEDKLASLGCLDRAEKIVYQRWFCGLILRRQMTGIHLYSSLLSWGQKLRRWLGHR